jgi:hypothetical protein
MKAVSGYVNHVFLVPILLPACSPVITTNPPPNGKYLFYTYENHLYRVSTEVIVHLKKQGNLL